MTLIEWEGLYVELDARKKAVQEQEALLEARWKEARPGMVAAVFARYREEHPGVWVDDLEGTPWRLVGIKGNEATLRTFDEWRVAKARTVEAAVKAWKDSFGGWKQRTRSINLRNGAEFGKRNPSVWFGPDALKALKEAR